MSTRSFIFSAALLSVAFISVHGQPFLNGNRKQVKEYESRFTALSVKIDESDIMKNLFYLCGDLPRRVLNWTVPGHSMSSLEEADLYISNQLKDNGYAVTYDETQVRAFGRDRSKPVSQQYARPSDDAPWYTAHNIIAEKRGSKHPDELIIIVAHKDSQSWIESPGANDNGSGTVGAMELAKSLGSYKPDHTIQFIFCNEEHTPWTSVTAAENLKKANASVLAVINLDGIGVKPSGLAGHFTNVTRFTTPEGEKLADLMDFLNSHHGIGLEQSKVKADKPGDDDGSFIKAGFVHTILNIGSMPYGDPNYHTEADTPDKTDIKNAAMAVKLTLAGVLYLDMFGRP